VKNYNSGLKRFNVHVAIPRDLSDTEHVHFCPIHVWCFCRRRCCCRVRACVFINIAVVTQLISTR
jgi:hypothetical protein